MDDYAIGMRVVRHVHKQIVVTLDQEEVGRMCGRRGKPEAGMGTRVKSNPAAVARASVA
jgi:hypothetical protein